MASSARKRARSSGGGEDEEPVPVADGFEAPIFGARVVGLSRCQLPRLETQRVCLTTRKGRARRRHTSQALPSARALLPV